MLDRRRFFLCINVLIERTAQSGVEHLDAAADTQYRNLPVSRQTRQQQFLPVAVRIDAMEFPNRIFVQEQWIQVTSACEQQSVQVFKGVDK